MKRAYDQYRTTHADFLRGPRATAENLHQLLGLLEPYKGGAILEIGCGGGELIAALRNIGFSNVIGVDGSEEQVSAAKASGIPVMFGDVTEFLMKTENLFDVILAIDLLEHLEAEDLLDTTLSAFDCLAPGGIFVARLPNPQSPFGGAIAFGDLTHRTHLAPSAALQLFRLSGFLEIEILPCSPAPAGWRRYVRRKLWRVQQRVFRLMFSIESGLKTQTVFSLTYLTVGRKKT